MTREMVLIIVKHALTLLHAQSPTTLRTLEPWLTRRLVTECQAHWRDEDPEMVDAKALILRMATSLRAQEAQGAAVFPRDE